MPQSWLDPWLHTVILLFCSKTWVSFSSIIYMRAYVSCLTDFYLLFSVSNFLSSSLNVYFNPCEREIKLIFYYNILTYLSLLQLEHRPSTIPLQHTRFWAASPAPFQLSFWALSSASVSRLQLLQGRPLLRFPWGFQLRACRVMLAGGFLSVWPIQPHFLWRICFPQVSVAYSVWPSDAKDMAKTGVDKALDLLV